jgi:hypothetical protein
MISDGRSNANGKVLIKGVSQNLLPAAQECGLPWLGLPIAAPGTRASHTYLICDLGPAQASITKLQDLLCRGGMSGRAAATCDDAGTPKLMAHGGPGNAQLGTDLAQGPAPGVQIGCTRNVHRVTVPSLSPDRRRPWFEVKRQAVVTPPFPCVGRDESCLGTIDAHL